MNDVLRPGRAAALCALLAFTPRIGAAALDTLAPAPAAQDTVVVVGAPKIPLAGDSVAVPVRYAPAAGAAAATAAVVQVVHDGRLLPPNAFRAALRGRGAGADSAAAPALVVHADSALTRGAGEYAAVVEMFTPAAGAGRPGVQSVAFTLVRPAAQLDTLPTLRVQRIVNLPWVWSTVHPDRVMLTEVGRQVAFEPEVRTVWGDLRRADVAPSGARVRLDLPERIAPGQQAVASLALEGAADAGTSSARLRVPSSAVAGGAVTLVVEVASRISYFWLLAAIAAGVWAGYYVRQTLEKRRLLDTALAGASAERVRLDGLIANTHDDVLRAALAAAQGMLLKDATAADATDATVNAAVKAAGDAREAALKDASARDAKARVDLAPWAGALAGADLFPGSLGAAVAPLRAAITAAGDLLSAGQTSDAQTAIDKLRNQLPAAAGAGGAWADGVRAMLNAVGPWPGTQVASGAVTLAGTADQCRAAFDAGVTDPAKFGDALRAAVALDASVSRRVAASLPDVATRAAGWAAAFRAWKGDALTPLARAVDDAVASLRKVLPRDGGPPSDLSALGTAVASLRTALQAMFQTALNGLSKNANDTTLADAVTPLLSAGDFQGVLDALTRAHDRLLETRAPDPQAAVPTREVAPTPDAGAPAVPTVPLPTLVIDVSNAFVRQPTTVTLHLDGALGGAPPGDARLQDVQWSIAGQPVALAPVPGGWTFVPPREGALVLSAVARLAGDGRLVRAERVVQVADRLDDPRKYADLAHKLEVQQTVILGIVTLVVGTLLFRATVVGTVDQLVAPFLWGFLGDVGLAQLRTSAGTLLNRTLPLAA